jgi:hypothetical protein
MDHRTLYDAERQAVRLAAAHTVADCVTVSVYVDNDRVIVRASNEPAPAGARVHCVTQRWDAKTVQIRRDNAWSEWVEVAA